VDEMRTEEKRRQYNRIYEEEEKRREENRTGREREYNIRESK